MKQSLHLESFFPYQFSVLAQQMSEYIAKIYHQQYGLSRYEWRVLACVSQSETIAAKEIMKMTTLDKMQVSRAIAKLTSNNYLCQQASEQDKRYNNISLTDAGQALYQEIVPLVKQQEQQMLAHLTTQEREQLITITQKLSQHL
ncbi:MAG: MarR family transcriptional regulator [Psychrobium sp.]|nr:MarR family transcriptional regulator [Psychrobium sp.]